MDYYPFRWAPFQVPCYFGGKFLLGLGGPASQCGAESLAVEPGGLRLWVSGLESKV